MTVICETERLIIREFTFSDVDFIIRLLNEESFIRYIADKNVRTHADAVNYLTNGPILSYQKYGYGLNMVQLKGEETPIGMCGLLKRAELQHPDLGYAFIPEFCGKGYAIEAAKSVLNEGITTHGLKMVLAVTALDNINSNRLLENVGFSLKGDVELYDSTNNLYEYRG